MRQNVNVFKDHFVHCVVAVITTLTEQRDWLSHNRQMPLVAHNFSFQTVACQRGGVQQSLGQTITDSGMQLFAFHFQFIEELRVVAEFTDITAFQQRFDVFFQERNEVFRQE
ncbi:Uncharacterised protein [Klebsiella pneumoniae]|nr:Uncharacterised protein [Klebsiella pneumoniae]